MGENIGFSAKFDTNFDTFAVDMHEVIGSSPTIPTISKQNRTRFCLLFLLST